MLACFKALAYLPLLYLPISNCTSYYSYHVRVLFLEESSSPYVVCTVSAKCFLYLYRDAASAELESGALEEAQAACMRVSQLGERPDIYSPLAQRLQHVSDWLRQRASVGLKDQGRDFFEGVWSGQQVTNC